MMAPGVRIAMWSGPRNISTAMMRAWENRPDCVVSDEPLYAAWLQRSGAEHPMREQVMAGMECDWRRVTAQLTEPPPQGRALWYQKHMCHHLLPEMHGPWLDALRHVFLIREPAAVARSYRKKHHDLSPEALGVPQQLALFRHLCERNGHAPPVIDSSCFLRDPEAHLRQLCAVLGVEFLESMLSWPAGPRSSDGPWAPHWYQAVWQSTGFGPPPPESKESLDKELQRIVAACEPAYQELYALRLQVLT